MIDEVDDKRDGQWGVMLSRCYGKVTADDEFRTALLESLKNRIRERAEGPRDVGSEANWSALLSRTYPPCKPSEEFRTILLRDMKDRQRQIVDIRNETVIQGLVSSYHPVQPRRDFETRLLENLKQRQKTRIIYKRTIRRRSIFASLASGLAAAAAVLFIVRAGPADMRGASSVPVFAVAAVAPFTQDGEAASVVVPISDFATASARDAFEAVPAVAEVPALAAFASRVLPKTAVGLGMELNDGAGWRAMDETTLTRVSPGMSFRSTDSTAILDFDNGSNILLRPGAVVNVAENGIGVERGELAVTVPHQTDNSLRILLADREVAVQPGTMLAVNAHNPDKYAAGGVPAPEVMISDGGLALARGKNGVGPLFANQVYLIDNYVTPDIPGRPMYAIECESMERDFAPAFDSGNSMSQLVSAPANVFTPRTPTGFRNDGGRLVANNYDNQDTVRIEYLSGEYFTLADSRRDLASAMALGANLIFDGGDGVFYEIYK
ncbi:MAG: hypothetical protein LBT97_10565 [Planctomycetota bacterium]|jgi:hypothetical protein|nr:hypothetical protein [Planctomycetota bacterium]